jgi:hypothetical protein
MEKAHQILQWFEKGDQYLPILQERFYLSIKTEKTPLQM